MLLMEDINRLKRKGYPMRRLGYGELLLLSQQEALFRTIQMELDTKDRDFIENRL
jgi:hypothetical protein